jgi:shikimate kinase
MKNISLIGPRGVGKTKVSRKLSKLLGWQYVITDMIAVYEYGGTSIPQVIEKSMGDWKGFRTTEKAILEKLATSHNIILDCGGGIIFDIDDNGKEIFSKEKSQLIKSMSTVVLLLQDKNYLVEKIANDASRPSLSSVQSYSTVFDIRLPYYKQVADHILRIDGMKPADVATKIIDVLNLKVV